MNQMAEFMINRRRFPRVFLQPADSIRGLSGAQVVWGGERRTSVLDLSYSGAAIALPPAANFEKGRQVSLDFEFEGQSPVQVDAKIIRTDGLIAGVQFGALDPKGRLAFEAFLNDNLLGLHLWPVDPGLFYSKQDFSQWYHGPKDTNVFLWAVSSKDGRGLTQVQKAIVELDGHILLWSEGTVKTAKSRSELNSATEDYYSPVLFESVRATEKPELDLLRRAIHLLSQIKKTTPEVLELLALLREAEAK